MRVKSIVLDGFKSYSLRQELSDLDCHFNAITGLNGSGKSNIFDAICFVMGISNLKKVRAEDPRELIYKGGNTGIQRATVTITFINDKPEKAPPGYPPEQFPQISVTRSIAASGKDKFFLADRISDRSKVKAFFHTLSLNVDNPHFLVLQGTVHKLVGMKSSEILGWLEEAAGTRVFDTRRRVAETLMRGRQKKLEEINRLIDEEAGPLLHSKKVQQDEYMNYQRLMETVEAKRKFRTAFDFWQCQMKIEAGDAFAKRLKESVKGSSEELKGLPGVRSQTERRLEELDLQRKEPLEELVRLNEATTEDKKSLAKAKQGLQARLKQVENLKRALITLQGEQEKTEERLNTSREEGDLEGEEHRRIKKEKEELENGILGLRESLRMLKAGVQAGENGISLVTEQSNVETQLTKAQGEHKRLANRAAGLEKETKALNEQVQKSKGSAGDLEKQLMEAEKAKQIADGKYRPYMEAQVKLAALRELKQKCMDGFRRLQQDNPNVQPSSLQYEPVPGEDLESAILGKVGELVSVKDMSHSLALSTGATPGNLYRVVLTHDHYAEVLIKKAKLQQRTSFLPMNKLTTAGAIEEERFFEAQRIAESMSGHVEMASHLVSADPQFNDLVARIFGSFVLCSDLELAKELARNPKTKMKAVTLDGDVADPNGVISGGSKTGLRDILADFASRSVIRKQFQDIQKKRQTAERQISELVKYVAEGQSFQEQYEVCCAKVEVLQEKLSHGGPQDSASQTYQANIQELEVLQIEMGKLQDSMKNLEARKKEISVKLNDHDVAHAEKELQTSLKQRQQRLKEVEERMKKTKDAFDKLENERDAIENKKQDTLTALAENAAEMGAASQERDQIQQEVETLSHSIERSNQQSHQLQEMSAQLEKEFVETQTNLKEIGEKQDYLEKQIKDAEMELRSLGKTIDDCIKKVKELDQQCAWLREEKDAFGQADGTYYFQDEVRTAKTLHELREMELLSEKMSNKVNGKATVLYEKMQAEYEEHLRKRQALLNDKETIIDTIKFFDGKKWDSLDRIVKQVSTGFEKLFSACLPGATARLQEERCPETNHLLGLQVKVSFHGKEKESLSELSGGQKSLLALCLILAILKSRPAPIYILDEVDAALDPSHTQNIGLMLRKYFSESQFLLVSLKDGMFKNAKVIYEIRNTQGYSQVTRKVMK